AAFGSPIEGTSLADLRAALEELDRRCAVLMSKERLNVAGVAIHYHADVCYVGQAYTLEVPLRLDVDSPLARLYEDFLVDHDRLYGHATRVAARIVNLRTVHQSRTADDRIGGTYRASGGKAEKGRRQILVAQSAGFLDALVLDRAALTPGFRFEGPAIVEQSD